MLPGDLYFRKRTSKGEDRDWGIKVKKGVWFKEKQLRPHWGEQTCSLAFKIHVFPCPGRSLGLLHNFKNVSVSEAVFKLKQTWMFWTFCLSSVELVSKKIVVNSPKLSNFLCSKFCNSVSWRTNLHIIFHYSTHCQWCNFIMYEYYICIAIKIYYDI